MFALLVRLVTELALVPAQAHLLLGLHSVGGGAAVPVDLETLRGNVEAAVVAKWPLTEALFVQGIRVLVIFSGRA